MHNCLKYIEVQVLTTFFEYFQYGTSKALCKGSKALLWRFHFVTTIFTRNATHCISPIAIVVCVCVCVTVCVCLCVCIPRLCTPGKQFNPLNAGRRYTCGTVYSRSAPEDGIQSLFSNAYRPQHSGVIEIQTTQQRKIIVSVKHSEFL